MWHKINNKYSPNFNLAIRSKKTIQYIIIHYTGMKKESSAINKLCNFNSNVSAHYFIKQNGDILNLVPDLYEAWHAGKSKWKKFRSLNKNSIGIEIQNPGHEHGYKNFSLKQINSLKKLLKRLIKFYKINQNNILGHSDIAPERKRDPGEKFPWKNLAKFKLAKWHTLNEKKIKKFRLIKLNNIEESQFLKNLYRIGYNEIKRSKLNYENKNLFKAFQRRFRQTLINGKSDQECLLITKNLLKS
jgi:N-acetylmuramoyl-L-alanine amidase